MKLIKLSKGYETIVDDDDYIKFGHLRWYADVKPNELVYAIRRIRIGRRADNKRKTIRLHREICYTPAGMVTDHINGNTLDNRKSNLRVATTLENSYNYKGQLRQRLYSRYKGVKKNLNCATWSARITVSGKSLYLGSFKSELLAAEAYNKAALEFHGQFACINEVA